jgi:uncharacterized protein (DUF885 family)
MAGETETPATSPRADGAEQVADNSIRALADELYGEWLTFHPITASEDGLPGYDACVPDLSVEAEQAYRTRLDRLGERLRTLRRAVLGFSAAVTAEVVADMIDREFVRLDCAGPDRSVSVALGEGPSALLTVAAHTAPATPSDAAAFLERCAQFPRYLDQHAQRLREGAGAGRRPVAGPVALALDQVDQYLADRDNDPLLAVSAPAGWEGAAAWRARLSAIVTESVRPAFVRWREAVAQLPLRPDAECGLCHLPDGERDYRRLVRAETSTSITSEEAHRLGHRQVEEISERMIALGAELGLRDLGAVMARFVRSRREVGAEDAMASARIALDRAQAQAWELAGGPLPPACEVKPMPPHLGRAGHAPHYTSPKLDGSAAGVFWFNSQLPETGGGWALEALTFHETVPGHHLQLGRAQQLDELPDIQRHGFIDAYGEGWALYAEVLAGEVGLYSTREAALGALVLQLFRAARLAVDTGIHALGWSRAEATEWLLTTVPLPAAFADAEVARYIANPAQALSYGVGLHELLRVREKARAALGPRFNLREFHRMTLGNGSIPLPTLSRILDQWIAARPPAAG